MKRAIPNLLVFFSKFFYPLLSEWNQLNCSDPVVFIIFLMPLCGVAGTFSEIQTSSVDMSQL